MNLSGSPATAMTINGSLPGPTLRWREGDNVTLRVRNRLAEDTSIHWHGIILPANMDGVPGLSFEGIAPGGLYEYRFKVRQNGTYWYHSHSGLQEQAGVYGALVIDAREPEPFSYDRDYVVLLSDWSDEKPQRILAKLKKQSDYYNFHKRTVGDFIDDVSANGWAATLADRKMWAEMKMSPTDLADVSGYTYTYLLNGQPPDGNGPACSAPAKAPPALRQRLGDELFRRPHSRPEDDRGGRRRTARRAGQRRRVAHRRGRDLRRDRRTGRRARLYPLRPVHGPQRLRPRHPGAGRRA